MTPSVEPETFHDIEMVWKGPIAEFMQDTHRLIDLEGAFRSGKTTAALWKVFNSCMAHPGIHWLICRYSDGDTQTKLKPPWRAICTLANVQVRWDSTELCDVFPNGPDPNNPYKGGSKVYIFGVKAQDQTSRYGKFRGMTLAGIYNDQTEELPHDVYLEMVGRLSQGGFPHQLLLTPNPPDENHWLCDEFPETQRFLDRRYYSVPIYANSHNLPKETIEGLESAYPVSHPKHRSAVLGKRGLNVIGKPVYGGDPMKGLAAIFDRRLHVFPCRVNNQIPLCIGLDFGRHHPCAVFAQYTPYGGTRFLGGIMGQNLYLEDFAPLIQHYRSLWFPDIPEILECCDPAGSHEGTGLRQNGIEVLKTFGIHARFKNNSNAPDVRLAMIERMAGAMRKRTPQGEAFGVESDPQKWLLISSDAVKTWTFLADGFEAGYVWDENLVSVGSKPVRRPKKDGWYDHGQNCAEYLELNFGGAQPTERQVERQMAVRRAAQLRESQRDDDPYRWGGSLVKTRGGY